MQSQHPLSSYQNNQHDQDDFDEVWVPNPHGQTQGSAATPGLIDIIKSGSLDSLLTNPWLVSIFVATVIFIAIATIATILAGQRNSEPTPELEALKRINLGASGKEAQLKYVDPSSGSWVTIPLDSAELAASGLVKLNIISNSRKQTTQRFDLVTVAQNTRTRLSEVKTARLEALRVKGLSPVASELEKTDWFGNKASPSQAEISDYQQDKPEPTPVNPTQPKNNPSPKPNQEGNNDK